MGIYIKGMEMPKDGVYWCEIGVANDIAVITIHGEDRKSFPLIPVPPHERLIDADALMKHCVMLPRDGGSLPVVYASYLRNAPTIIPAEEVYDVYQDTVGNLHWTGTHSGKHIVPIGEARAEEDT